MRSPSFHGTGFGGLGVGLSPYFVRFRRGEVRQLIAAIAIAFIGAGHGMLLQGGKGRAAPEVRAWAMHGAPKGWSYSGRCEITFIGG